MNRDAQGRLHHAAGAPASLGGKYAPDNKRGGAAMPSTLTEPAPIEMSTYRSEIDGATVIELDTKGDPGQIRVNINDGTVYNADPETSEPPKFVAGPDANNIVIPARPVRIQSAAHEPQWPEELGRPSIEFGEGDQGAFFSSYTFDVDGEEVSVIMTDYGDGAEWSYTDEFEEKDQYELLDQLAEEVAPVHTSLRTNMYRVGAGACEEMPELRQHIIKTTTHGNFEETL